MCEKRLFFGENWNMFTNNLISVKAAKILRSILLLGAHTTCTLLYGLFQKKVFIGAQVGRNLHLLETAHRQFPHSIKVQALFVLLHYQILYTWAIYMAPQIAALRVM